MAEHRLTKPSPLETIRRLLVVATGDTGQSAKVADFLLAWWNPAENGRWNMLDLWAVDRAIGADMVTVLGFIAQVHRYPDGLGFKVEFEALWERWRGGKVSVRDGAGKMSDGP
jgi:hypothetical protein